MSRLHLKDIPLEGKKVLIRVDFNVPLDPHGRITDDTRIVSSLPTIRYVLGQGGRPILMSHLGRPKGKEIPSLSLAPCARRLAEILGKPVIMASDCVGEKVRHQIEQMNKGEVLLLENLRFHPGEEKPEENREFVQQLASLADIYINDAFGTAHRKHASTYAIVPLFNGNAAPGFLLEREIEFLGNALNKPKRPFFAIIGGAKVSSKIGVMKSLVSKVDTLFLGGAMAYTFLKVKGIEIGSSKFESDYLDTARAILDAYEDAGVQLLLPEDHVVAADLNDEKSARVVSNSDGIPAGYSGVDIGPRTIKSFSEVLKLGKTIFWNGPMGVFEHKPFAAGTKAIASVLAELKATTIIGGGDSVAAIRSMNLVNKFTHLSTGGGASLEYIEFGNLPGIEVLYTVPTSEF